MTPNSFRKMALALPGAEERSHMKHPDFRVNGKIFAGLGSPDPAWATVKLPVEHQAALMKTDAETFVPASGAWGRSGWTSIRLASADSEAVGEALTAAWKIVSVKKRASKL
jgi:hypothetical protein